MVAAKRQGEHTMSQYIAPADLAGMTEQELRALHGRILADLRRTGQSAFLSPGIYASLQSIEEAILRLQQQAPLRPRPPQGPKL